MPDTDYTDLNAQIAALLFGLRRVNPVDGAENCWTDGSDLTRHNKLCQGLTDYAGSWEGAQLVEARMFVLHHTLFVAERCRDRPGFRAAFIHANDPQLPNWGYGLELPEALAWGVVEFYQRRGDEWAAMLKAGVTS